MVAAVQLVDPFVEVLHVVGVHEVHDDGDAQLVRPLHQRLQLLGGAEARRRGEEVRHMVAERSVVGVLGDSHQLHGVVAVLADDGQNLLREFAVAAHPFALLGHADMGFVDQQVAVPGDIEPVVRPVEGLRNPELGRVVLRLVVLHHARGVGRNAVVPAVVAVHVDLVERAVREAIGVHGVGQEDRPHAAFVLVEPQLGALPAVEVAEQIDVLRGGQPLAEPPAAQILVPLPAVVAVAVGVVDQRPGRFPDAVELFGVEPVAVFDFALHGAQPFVLFDNGKMCLHSVSLCIFYYSLFVSVAAFPL